MHYARIKPSEDLAHMVYEIWLQEDNLVVPLHLARPTRVLPSGCLDLIVNYRDPFLVRGPDGWQQEPKLSFVGQRTRPVEVVASGQTGILIVRFHPWAARHIFAVRLSELRDCNVPLRDLMDKHEYQRLIDELGMCSDGRERVDVVVAFLRRTAVTDLNILARAKHAISVLKRAPKMKIDQLAKQLGLSRRQLQRQFDFCVGLGPKSLGAIFRFQSGLRLFRAGLGWRDVVDCCGFYDQAHLIHEVKRFTQSTPQCPVLTRDASPLSQYFASTSPSHFYNTAYL